MTTISYPTFIRRPNEYVSGIWGWLTTVDHKRIGTLYGVTAFIWFLIAGIEAILIRIQLSQPEMSFVTPEVYNQLFTMHGTTMIFLVVMPLSAAFFNWLVPLQIGARDVAFPRLNAFSYWAFLFGGILLNFSWLIGDAPNAGWFAYAPNTGVKFNPSNGVTFWIIGLQILGIASLAAGFNFFTTIINMRAPGMTWFKLPVFIWMTAVVNVLIVLAFPVITVALIQLQFDRLYGTGFFNPAMGGDPVMWQHMFWLFGHPEVYILILPAMGIVSEVLPTFSRKPIFGYSFIVFSGIAIGFLGWFVWSHHMFTVGLGPAANAAFSVSTMLIAVPTGVKIFNWIGTLWGGSIKVNTALLFSVAFIGMFVIGGLSGVTHASPPSDAQQQDTYYVVAHFHYVLFGGSLLGLWSGIYYWWPKFTGRFLNEKLGLWHFGIVLLGFNLTFFPMHWLGLDGMPRRVATYPEGMGWDVSNLVSTMGSLLLGVGVLIFIYNIIYSNLRMPKNASNDPWDGRTLEWSIPSPPPHYNFDVIPEVKYRDDFWYKKYPELVDNTHGGGSDYEDQENHEVDHADIHMPDPSYYPLFLGLGLTVMVGGLIPFTGHWVVSAIGLIIFIWSFLGWSYEPVNG
jgi:cytochrome c oxidase subunit 1